MTNSATTCEQPSDGLARTANSSLAARGILAGLRGYRRLRVGRVSACRFYPSCSDYATEAVETHGAIRGGALAVRRILRCRPLGAHGIDLVPVSRRTV
jgi:uncharacterized protein